MQNLRERPQPAAGNAVHEVRKVQQHAARGLVAALVRDAVEGQRAAAFHKLVD